MNANIISTSAAIAFVFIVGGCSCTPTRCDTKDNNKESLAHQAHENFVNAINSNELDRFLSMVTDDVVFMAPNAPCLVGKDEVAPWAAGYYEAFQTNWEKTSLEFVFLGDWAFEQYAYRSEDIEKSSGTIYRDTGKGIIIYRLDDDGVWRVARDAWNSDQPLTAQE